MPSKPWPTKLPADIPILWGLADMVASYGSVGGYPERYGFNYLNKQVNELQNAINTVNDAFDTIFDDTDVHPVPVGWIGVYVGPLSDIPAGWVLCNGQNGTPNLLGRFPKCVPNAATNPGAIGGADARSLTTALMPEHDHGEFSHHHDGTHYHTMIHNHPMVHTHAFAHQHSMQHSHTISLNANTDSGGVHRHNAPNGFNFVEQSANVSVTISGIPVPTGTTAALALSTGGANEGWSTSSTAISHQALSHTHAVTGTAVTYEGSTQTTSIVNTSGGMETSSTYSGVSGPATDDALTNSITVTLQNQGTGTAFATQPRHMAVAFIMKV